jgi:glycine/D-amino acid oxidase-like deaminating enzyme
MGGPTLGATLLGCGRPLPPLPPLTGRILGRERAAAGHRLRGPVEGLPSGDERFDVVIVGAGIAGLSAAWRLGRAGVTSILLLDLDGAVGGTAQAGGGAGGPHPLGAHYITLPNPAAVHVRTLLAELGVIRGYSGGRPRYDEAALCAAPQERLFQSGVWSDGLWPAVGATDEDRRQREDFEAHCEGWRRRRGADGRRAFEIPIAKSSMDPEIRALASRSFADHAAAQGWTSPRLLWQLRYACRDDFGTELADTSAWAGLHYHCARDPDPADPDLGTDVLTWPGGNGWLVEQLLARQPGVVRSGALARRVQPAGEGVEVWYEADVLRRVIARHAVLAVPARVGDALTGRSGPEARPEATPWRVAALTVDRPPGGLGVPGAWDSVLHEGAGLGYVDSGHQRLRRGGPSVLSWYEPLSRGAPREEARGLLAATWEGEVDRVLTELSTAHPALRRSLLRADVMHWGHGTVRPSVGLHGGDGLAGLAAARGPISFAHTDLSGMSLFEEASWHGVRAAEEALVRLGRAGESLL